MGWTSRLLARFTNSQCPLCGGSTTYKVSGFIGYVDLLDNLRTKSEWLKAHGLEGGIPQLPSEYTSQIPQIRLPGFNPPARESLQPGEAEHRRCKTCDSLLPPEFWNKGPGSRQFAITVAGFAGTGKTTWLLSMLNPTNDDSYEIVRRSQWLRTESYEYAEPATLTVLRGGLRTNIPFFLFGTTIRYSTNIIRVKTLDIMGERFLDHVPETKPIITRHLSTSDYGNGALLILDKFATRPPLAAKRPHLENIARVYEEIAPASSIWKGVVWTHLDQAQWSEAGEAWLKQNLPDHSEVLLKLATSMRADDSPLPDDFVSQLDQIDSRLVWSLAGAAMRLAKIRHESYDSYAKENSGMPSFSAIVVSQLNASALEALIFLLLRLQMAYSLKAAGYELGKHEYLEQGGGHPIYSGILWLARALYVLWDFPRGNLHQFVKQDESFDILPCGLVGGCSVWSDLILLRAMHGSGVL